MFHSTKRASQNRHFLDACMPSVATTSCPQPTRSAHDTVYTRLARISSVFLFKSEAAPQHPRTTKSRLTARGSPTHATALFVRVRHRQTSSPRRRGSSELLITTSPILAPLARCSAAVSSLLIIPSSFLSDSPPATAAVAKARRRRLCRRRGILINDRHPAVSLSGPAAAFCPRKKQGDGN